MAHWSAQPLTTDSSAFKVVLGSLQKTFSTNSKNRYRENYNQWNNVIKLYLLQKRRYIVICTGCNA